MDKQERGVKPRMCIFFIFFYNYININIDKVDKPRGGSGKVDKVFCNIKTFVLR